MRRYRMALLAALTAMLFVSLASEAAYALRSIAVEPERNFRAEGVLTFGDRALERMTRIICRVVFKATLANSIPKRRGAVFGKITNMEIEVVGRETCRWGEFLSSVESIRALKTSINRLELNSECRINGRFLECNTTGGIEELWNLLYESILGTLPNIHGILFQIAKALIKIESRDIFGVQNVCLYEGNIFTLFEVTEENRIGLGSILLSLSVLRVRRLLGTCPESAKVGGTLNPNTLENVRLV